MPRQNAPTAHALGAFLFGASLRMRYTDIRSFDSKRSAMATLKHTPGNHRVLDTTVSPEAGIEDTIEMRRARRRAALEKIAGIWSNRADIPADGLEYQRQLRLEWRD
jgi:hypothetical protein